MADTRTEGQTQPLTIQSVWEELQALEAQFMSFQTLNNGNIGLTGVVNGYLKSPDFVSGSKGWQLSPDGSFEGNSGTFRGALTGNTITGATIIGGTIETASGTGQRVVIQGSDNTLRFYDSSNNLIIGMGTTASNAFTITTNSTVSNGIVITSTVAGFALNYTNSLSNLSGNAGISLNLTGTSNVAANLQITNNGINGAQGILMTITGAAAGLYITNSGTGNAVTISGSSVFTGIDIENSISTGSPTGMIINETVGSSGNPNGINISLGSGSGTCTAFVLSIAGSSTNSYLFSHAASGMVVTSAVTGVNNKKVRVNIAGAVYFIPLYDA